MDEIKKNGLNNLVDSLRGYTSLLKNNDKKLADINNSILDDVEALQRSMQSTIDTNYKNAKAAGTTQNRTGFNSHVPPFQQNYEEEQKKSSLTSSSIDSEKVVAASLQKQKEDAEAKAAKANIKLLDKKKVRELGENLKARVFGQDEVIDEVVDILKVAALNIKINKQKPAGCYLFAGPSGVGKTELAQSMSDQLGVPLLKINMGEYGLEQDVTKLIGTSKGYVGYNEGGLLTNFVSENPACVVLLDELEKAHHSIDKILLSIMDHGSCTDNKGDEVIFKETIIISTSNLGAEVEYQSGLDKSTKNKIRMASIKEGLRPEIINRYDSIFHFNSLTPDIYKLVTNKFLVKLDKDMLEEHQFAIKFTPKLVDFIVEKSYDPSMGGRPARKFIEKIVIKPLADRMLEDDFDEIAKEAKEITMDLNKDGNIVFKAKKKILGVLEDTAKLVARVEDNKFTNPKKADKPINLEEMASLLQLPNIQTNQKVSSTTRKRNKP